MCPGPGPKDCDPGPRARPMQTLGSDHGPIILPLNYLRDPGKERIPKSKVNGIQEVRSFALGIALALKRTSSKSESESVPEVSELQKTKANRFQKLHVPT